MLLTLCIVSERFRGALVDRKLILRSSGELCWIQQLSSPSVRRICGGSPGFSRASHHDIYC